MKRNMKFTENDTLVDEYTVNSGVGMPPDDDDMLTIAPFLRSTIWGRTILVIWSLHIIQHSRRHLSDFNSADWAIRISWSKCCLWVSECVGFWRPTRHIIGHFGDESFQAINCTGTGNQKQSNTTLHTVHQKHKRETEKTALANKTI